MADYETLQHDVLVIAAGGAGLRAAIEASAAGVSVGLVYKSLLGKAHTVMAEGGIAAALANVDDRDSWRVHFADTMRGGQHVNNWRMAELHGYGVSDTQAKELLGRITGDYERAYYTGLLAERRAKAKLAAGGHSSSWAYGLLRDAMNCYEKAEAVRPPGNDDALLRWNTCARIIARNKLVPREEDSSEPVLE